jgi:phospholipid/cholesterol/gamma-HCH transport system substrate-binding protein
VDRFTKEELKNLIIGLCVIGFCLVCVIAIKLDRNTWKDAEDTDYNVYATFNRTDGLSIGDKVRMSGIDVGHVEKSVLDDDYRATLTLKIREGTQIPDDSSASIVSSGIMGNKYIEIEPGGSEEYIDNNGEFFYTQDAIVLEELVDRIISLGKAKRNGTKHQTAQQPQEEN